MARRQSSPLPFLLLPLLCGCSVGIAKSAEADSLHALIEKAREEHAQRCSPKAFALAEAHEEFARLELTQGNFLRAEEHLAIASSNAKQALRESVGCQEREIIVKGPGDRDQDGVSDLADACPDDPEDQDTFEDDDGCPDPDNDQDQIADKDDSCPLDPEDKDAFQDEDGCPDSDNDQDQIVDADDSCPLDPEDQDTFEDDDGCPDPDNDQDQIADKDDSCPLDPEIYNGIDDSDGCPDYKLVVVTPEKIELSQKIFFAKARTKILKKSYPLLDEVAQVLKDHPKITVRIEGHTSSEGSEAYNQKLSQGRAEAVRSYLIKQGIDGSRMEAKGYGESLPIDDNSSEAGRERNRRVEFFITAQ